MIIAAIIWIMGSCTVYICSNGNNTQNSTSLGDIDLKPAINETDTINYLPGDTIPR